MPTKNSASLFSLLLLAALTASPIVAPALSWKSAIAQTPATSVQTFPLPKTVASGSALKVDGSNSMTVINQFLKRRYETEYPGTKVELGGEGITTDEALQALRDGKIDLAAIGRPLTEAEKAAGLIPVTISREKIAILVSPNNPFKGNITFKQFAQIFRGEITDWAQLGGQPGKIRFIDRPETSDTRQAFKPYPVFQAAPFEAGADTVKADKDSTAEIIKQLGTDGISYAVYSQVKDLGDVQIISMHKTLPDDPRYPFSKPRYYVYKNTPTPAVAAFLGYATNEPGQKVVLEADAAEAQALATGKDLAIDPAAAATAAAAAIGGAVTAAPGESPSPTIPASPTDAAPTAIASPTPTAATGQATATNPNDLNLLWWLLLPLGAVGAWWLASRRGAQSAIPAAPPETPPAPVVPPTAPEVPVPPVAVPPVAGSLTEVPPVVPPAPGAPIADPSIVPAAIEPPKPEGAPISPLPNAPEVAELPEVPTVEPPGITSPKIEPPTLPTIPPINPAIAAGAAGLAGIGLAGLARREDQAPPEPPTLE
jgi:ABC-type phosphate transport system substrate-binding protein